RIGLVITTADGEKIINTNNRFQPSAVELSSPVTSGVLRIKLGQVPLVGGRYFVSFWFGDPAHDSHIVENALVFEVIERDIWGLGRVPVQSTARLWWPTTYEAYSAADAEKVSC
ncbi:MAG TPA: Wzt carbohydrate-binding domain-containing protein, partial [Phycisphaerales bacterium]|nr:Wzt carbohydrate-binding domain-containing protein [Phycisphaerales bacterium]